MRISRNGTSLLEVSTAIVLLGALTTIVAQALDLTKLERQESERREVALAEAANAMEHLAAEDWEALVPAAAAEIPLSGTAKEMLPGGRLTKTIEVIRDGPAAKRIVVEVQWLGRTGEPQAPLRLTTWTYQRPVTKAGTP